MTYESRWKGRYSSCAELLWQNFAATTQNFAFTEWGALVTNRNTRVTLDDWMHHANTYWLFLIGASQNGKIDGPLHIWFICNYSS